MSAKVSRLDEQADADLARLERARGADGPADGAPEGAMPFMAGPATMPTVHLLRGFMAMAAPPLAFAVEPIIPRGLVTLLGGHGGTGKSLLGLILAAHVAAGVDWAGFKVTRSRVAVVSLEDEGAWCSWQLQRIVRAYELPADAVAEGITLVDGTNAGPLAKEENIYGAHLLAEGRAMRPIVELVKGCGMIVVDNASDAYDANESARGLVRAFVSGLAKIARAEDAAVLLLAHINADSARNGSRGESYSGSTAWHNSARSRLALIPVDDRLELRHEKANRTAKAKPVALAWTEVGVLWPASEAVEASAAAARALVAKADARAVLDVLRALLGDGVAIPTANTGQNTAAHVLQRAGELPEQLRGNAGRERIKAALLALERAGEIVRASERTPDRKFRERWHLAERSNGDHGEAKTGPEPPCIGAPKWAA